MEYLDIRTENGELTGEIKERTQVHTDGDIHGTYFTAKKSRNKRCVCRLL